MALLAATLAALALAAPALTPAERSSSSPAPTASSAPLELAELAELGGAGAGAWHELWAGALDALEREPSFNKSEEAVVAAVGAPAFLHCAVRHLRERGVSWLRRRDWHILSSGPLLYTNDDRFQVLHAEGSDDWILQIKYVQARDNGTYECHVPTGAGTLARRVHLLVAEPEAFILGAEEHHVDAGSAVNLVCIIEKSPEPPQYVLWYHNARMVNYEPAGGVAVSTVAGAGERTQSALHIRAARPHHSGNYTCAAANTRPAHILVYVERGSDKMAATLSRDAAPARGPPRAARLLALAGLAALWPRPH